MIHDLTKYRESKKATMCIFSGPSLLPGEVPDAKCLLVSIKLKFVGYNGVKHLEHASSGVAMNSGVASWFRVYNFYTDMDVVLQGTVGYTNADLILEDTSLTAGCRTFIETMSIRSEYK